MKLSQFTQTLPKKDKVLLFGGTYGNLRATQALIALAKSLGYAPDSVIGTGDLTAYCAHPTETLDLLKDWGVTSIWGNVEESLVNELDDCGCNFVEGSSCDLLSPRWYNFLKEKIRPQDLEWMSRFPKHIKLTIGQYKVMVVHGSYRQVNQFVFPSKPDQASKLAQLNQAKADIMIAGHSGIPFIQKFLKNNRYWINVGAVGMPANDGTTRTWCCELIHNTQSDKLTVKFHPIDYNYKSEAQMMINNNLPQPYAKALLTGIWPDQSILPGKEKKLKGKKLVFQTSVLL